jgi:predicted transposase YbfD/YdcC
MGCQKAIAAQIIQQESDYLLMVKNNQPTLGSVDTSPQPYKG